MLRLMGTRLQKAHLIRVLLLQFLYKVISRDADLGIHDHARVLRYSQFELLRFPLPPAALVPQECEPQLSLLARHGVDYFFERIRTQ